jgi:hypothetical protein
VFFFSFYIYLSYQNLGLFNIVFSGLIYLCVALIQISIFSWFNVHIHSPMVRLLEIPFGNIPWRRSKTPSSRTRLGIWLPFLQEGNLSGEDGSTGPRVQWMDRLADKKTD